MGASVYLSRSRAETNLITFLENLRCYHTFVEQSSVGKMAAKYLGFGSKGDQTAVRKKKFTEGTLRHSLYKQTQESISNGEDPRAMVKIQEGTPLEDWLAVHVVDFFNRIQMLYLLIYDACTEESCPKMSGGARVEYLWQDGIKHKVSQISSTYSLLGNASIFWGLETCAFACPRVHPVPL